jgi:23S rRNA pseudouridine1911/1915/1917 synthase
MAIPYVLDETASYIVVYKPPRLHSVPRNQEEDSPKQTLVDWCARICPEVREVQGRNPWEGGILHRLDYETQGLVLFAKTQIALDRLILQQEQGLFIKDYDALSVPHHPLLPGFPQSPLAGPVPFTISSSFRPFGPGRKAVRPIMPDSSKAKRRKIQKTMALDQGQPYRTEILEMRHTEKWTGFRVRISRGFRHQIRCHLAWIGFPLVNDGLYGGIPRGEIPPHEAGFAPLALIACLIFFYDPISGLPRQYTIPGFLDSFDPVSKQSYH